MSVQKIDNVHILFHTKETMQSSLQWKNKSVLAFAQNHDPIVRMEHVAQRKVLEAISSGWHGPPFDPLELASLMGIQVRPNASIPDARISKDGDRNVIEFNPNKSAARVNFSIAHEIAHTFFEDWHERPRHRAKYTDEGQNWQLEMLCNIGAAEILMPLGTFGPDVESSVTIERVLELRQKFKVSTEAVLIRLAKVAKAPLATFAASSIQGPGSNRFRIDYSIPSAVWQGGRLDGLFLEQSEALSQCVAIGNTANSIENWGETGSQVRVQAVGLPPYPGTGELRFAGIIEPTDGSTNTIESRLDFRYGDASKPIVDRDVAIVHVVNDKARRWGGRGFAPALFRSFPDAAADYADWTSSSGEFSIGNIHSYSNAERQVVVSLVAQEGYGQSRKPRIRYQALQEALQRTAHHLIDLGVRLVQMPRIGSGQAGGNWQVIEGIIFEELVLRGIDVKVFDLSPQ